MIAVGGLWCTLNGGEVKTESDRSKIFSEKGKRFDFDLVLNTPGPRSIVRRG